MAISRLKFEWYNLFERIKRLGYIERRVLDHECALKMDMHWTGHFDDRKFLEGLARKLTVHCEPNLLRSSEAASVRQFSSDLL